MNLVLIGFQELQLDHLNNGFVFTFAIIGLINGKTLFQNGIGLIELGLIDQPNVNISVSTFFVLKLIKLIPILIDLLAKWPDLALLPKYWGKEIRTVKSWRRHYRTLQRKTSGSQPTLVQITIPKDLAVYFGPPEIFAQLPNGNFHRDVSKATYRN